MWSGAVVSQTEGVGGQGTATGVDSQEGETGMADQDGEPPYHRGSPDHILLPNHTPILTFNSPTQISNHFTITFPPVPNLAHVLALDPDSTLVPSSATVPAPAPVDTSGYRSSSFSDAGSYHSHPASPTQDVEKEDDEDKGEGDDREERLLVDSSKQTGQEGDEVSGQSEAQHTLSVVRTPVSNLSSAQRQQKPCSSDYSSLSSSESPRVSDASTRSDIGTSPGNSSSSSSSGALLRNSDLSLKKVTVCGGLSPIASCGDEFGIGAGPSVSLGPSPEPSPRDTFDHSPVTPTSGCLKGGGRTVGGAHVQFDTPYDEEERQPLQETVVAQDGQVSLHKSRATTPTPGDQISRLWARLQPDSSPSEVTNLPANKKWRRRRHVSGSSSISLGSSSSSSSNNSCTTELERRAPDGGWGWVIVAASFMVHCIADGVTLSFGVLFVELLSYFKEGKSLTSWVGSLFMAIPLLAGPLASMLTDRYGCQTVTICGALIASFGFFVSAFVNSIPLLLLTVGIVTGLGLAVCYVAAIVIVAFYFEKKRSLATGIAVAGSGIGTFLFAPLIQHLVDDWGWRLCFIILAGIFLNMVVCGALMRDLEWTPRNSNCPAPSAMSANSHHVSTSRSSETVGRRESGVGMALPSLAELRRLIQSGDVAALISPDDAPTGTLRSSASLVLLPTFLSHSHVLPPDVLPCLSSRTNAYEVVSHMYPHLLSHSLSSHVPPPGTKHSKLTDYASTTMTSIGSSGGYSRPAPPPSTAVPASSAAPMFSDTDATSASPPLDTFTPSQPRKKIDVKLGFSSGEDEGDDADNEEEREEGEGEETMAMLGEAGRGKGVVVRGPGLRRISAGCLGGTTSPPPPAAPLRNMRVNRQSMTYRGAMLNIHRYRLRASSCPDIYRNSIITIAKDQDETVWTYLDDMGEMLRSCIDVSYCLDPSYLVFAVSNFVLYVFYDTVYMYLTDYAQGVGISADESANLISVIGILNCVGMVVMGYVGDQEWSSPILIYNVSMVVCGVAVITMPFLANYWLLGFAAAIFGLFISANYALTSVIVVELVSLEAFSKAYGLLLLIQGVANLIGPPLVGFIADTTGNYVVPFTVSGFFIIVCGLILNTIPLINRYRDLHNPHHSPPDIRIDKNGSSVPTMVTPTGKKGTEPIIA